MTKPKLSRIPGTEPTVKHSFTLRASTSEQLVAYHLYYCKAEGIDPAKLPLKDVAEQMFIDFMASDKDFQRSLEAEQPPRGTGAKAAAATPAPAPSAASSFSLGNPPAGQPTV